ncbi:aminotransferase class I/II-fold pyridoxal phosphate-dependent enzyme [Bacillus manliponensis]|uniref:aminotransferase class I/II-fold pyridoxal phosphate-dependent enzyme n=1 Tax=Bacillus manliponensis TaxID=574376 RepID=UPI003510F3AC
MNQKKMPVYETLMKFANNKPLSFHVPGHKNGMYFPERGKEYFRDILSIDVTELTGLDDLHDPSECIAEAQELLSNLYGAQKSYFLVNGSTVGNLAMIFACCKEGDIVLVQRNCHKSIMNGLILTGAQPVFLDPWIDEEFGVPVGVPLEDIKEAIKAHPNTKALILTHPNYYGMGGDLKEIIAFSHKHNIPVLVDEAHGAHFCLGDPFPLSALSYGADVVVHSAHKTLPAMTMGSYLHINSQFISSHRIEMYLSMLQSSSPSYPIMASLDLARFALTEIKENGCNDIVKFLIDFRNGLHRIPQIKVLQYKVQDLLKVTIQTRCELSGYELQHVLEEQGLYAEMADPYNVLLVMPLKPSQKYMTAVDRMKKALQNYEVKDRKPVIRYTYKRDFSPVPFTYKQLDGCKKSIISLEEAVGRVCADMVIPYPPGIPLLMYGEKITSEHVQRIYELQKTGARFQGSIHIQEKNICVYDI